VSTRPKVVESASAECWVSHHCACSLWNCVKLNRKSCILFLHMCSQRFAIYLPNYLFTCTLKIVTLWNVTTTSFKATYQHFGKTYWIYTLPWICRRRVPSKCLCSSARVRAVTRQEDMIILTFVRISNLTYLSFKELVGLQATLHWPTLGRQVNDEMKSSLFWIKQPRQGTGLINPWRWNRYVSRNIAK
jgi:hypothetical protein